MHKWILLLVTKIGWVKPLRVYGLYVIMWNRIILWIHFWERGYASWLRHQMETFSALLAICAGNSPVAGEFPVQRPVTRSCDAFFDLRLNTRLRKNGEDWDLRRHSVHYGVTVTIHVHTYTLIMARCWKYHGYSLWKHINIQTTATEYHSPISKS